MTLSRIRLILILGCGLPLFEYCLWLGWQRSDSSYAYLAGLALLGCGVAVASRVRNVRK